MDQNTHTSKTIALIAAGLVVVGALLMFLFNNKGETPAAENTAPVPPQGEPIVPPTPPVEGMMENEGEAMEIIEEEVMPATQGMDSSYNDGTYTTQGDYTSPAGPEVITVKVTLKDGKIVDSVVTGTSTNDVTKKFMAGFAQNHKALVVGKSIDEVNLTVVSGSSLTPKGFNAALEAIKKEAQS
ncbi:MAG: hypothetical protein RI911_117 [Candidatus Parcubacteria bacterium]|jgi:uncharacterized protein with FMN-binding domain